MSWRAVLIGAGLGLLIAGVTYFNDQVMRQTMLIGHFLPISVFGVIVVGLLGLNPLLRRVGPGWPLRASEVGVIAAIALAACAYPGSNWGRYFGTMATMPAYHARTLPDWQTHQVLSYLPGGSPLLAPGQVRDWASLVATVEAARGTDTTLARLYDLAEPDEQWIWKQAFEAGGAAADHAAGLARVINRVLADPRFSGVAADLPRHAVEEAGRTALVDAAPGLVLPPPRGGGATIGGGKMTRDVERFVAGVGTDRLLPLDVVPWATWWPTLRLWAGAVALLGITSVCLAVIVHPQWSRREMLPYPIARFVQEASQRSDGSGLPDVARSRLFWVGFGSIVVLHTLNGLHAWLDWPVHLPLQMDFGPLRELFPNASRVALAGQLFYPQIFLSVVAFTFLLNRKVSFTLGIAHFLFVAVGAMFVSRGLPMEYDKFVVNKMNMLRLGAYIGLAGMILYTGRRYYLNVLTSGLGVRPRLKETPPASTWAARLGVLSLCGAAALLTTSGMSPLVAALLVLLAMLIWLVLGRLVAETGIFLVSGPFMALGVLPGILGMEALGPTQIILLGTAGFLLLGDPREALLPFVTNALQIADRTGTRIGRLWPGLIVMAIASLVLATVVTLALQYEHGPNKLDQYAFIRTPSDGFHQAAAFATEAMATGTLFDSVALTDMERLARLSPEPAAIAWLGLGLVLVVSFATARLRLTWWPLHPIVFIVGGTWAMGNFAISCLLGWMIRSAVVGTAGARGYQLTLPLMIGVIAGELLSGLAWMIVGGAYWALTGLPPEPFRIFP
jgi:hypothetical protein